MTLLHQTGSTQSRIKRDHDQAQGIQRPFITTLFEKFSAGAPQPVRDTEGTRAGPASAAIYRPEQIVASNSLYTEPEQGLNVSGVHSTCAQGEVSSSGGAALIQVASDMVPAAKTITAFKHNVWIAAARPQKIRKILRLKEHAHRR